MRRFQLTALPAVRAWAVDQIRTNGTKIRIKTFPESEYHDAIKLVARLNKSFR